MSKNSKKRYFLHVLGCQMNYADAERISSVLAATGWEKTEEAATADLYIFVTCSIRQKAEDRVFGFFELLNDWKKERPGRQVGLTGCMAKITSNRTSTKQDPLLKKCPVLDLVWRIVDTQKLPELLGRQFAPTAPDENEYYRRFFAIDPLRTNPKSAQIPIMTGCDNWCSYCIVPLTRGREVSRSPKEILAEVTQAIKNGAIEITLLGQNVDSYQKSSEQFAELLTSVAELPGVERVRFMSSHPKDLSVAVLKIMQTHKNIERHLHLAVQHGDDEILRRMNRGYTAAEFLEKVKIFRKLLPEATLTTDLIVGFPGEDEAAFQRLVDFYKAADFDFAFISRYSPRRGTTSHKLWRDDVPAKIKAERWNILNELLLETTKQHNQKYIGKKLEVLVERCIGDVCMGRSSEFLFVKFPGTPDLVGKIVPVTIQIATELELLGEVSSTPTPALPHQGGGR